jgi:hypothetical protein
MKAMGDELDKLLAIPRGKLVPDNCPSLPIAEARLERRFVASIGSIYGLKLVSSPYATIPTQFRFPRSKKKRLRKKWKKNKNNWRSEPAMFMMNDTAIAHPVIIAQIQESTKRQEESHFKKWG